MAMNSEFDRDVTFEIIENIGVIADYSTGWKKELNLVSWNGGAAKYDIRDWAPDHEHMSRGVTLHEKEMRLIMDLFKRRRQNRLHNDRRNADERGACVGSALSQDQDVMRQPDGEDDGERTQQ